MNVYISVVLVYFLFIIVVSFFTKKIATRSSADFLVAGRNLGVITCSIVVASEWLGGMSTIGVSEKAYLLGTMQPILLNFSTAIGMIIIGFTVAYHYRKNDIHTVSEMLEKLFGSKARLYSAIAFLIAYITLSYVQIQTCASIVAPLFNLNWFNAVLFSVIFITIYTYIGGMHALSVIGVIHLLAKFIGIGIALYIGLSKVGGLGNLQSLLAASGSPEDFYNPFSGNLSYAFNLLIGGVLGGMAAQASIQPIFSAKNALTAKRAALLSALIIAPFGIMVAILGLIGRTGLFFDKAMLVSPKMVLPALLTNPEFIHPVLGGIAIAGILAAIFSTVGPVNFAIVTIAAKDIYHGILNKGALDHNIIKASRRLVVIVCLVTFPMAYYFKGAVLDAAYISYAIRSIGAIVIIMGLYYRKWISVLSVKMAFIIGTLSILFTVLGNNLGWFHIEETYVGVISAVVCVLMGNVITYFKE